MVTLLLILTTLNTIGLGILLVQKFKEKFIILDIDTYQALGEFWNKYHDDEGNELERELAGGTGVPAGFFREALYDEEEEEE